MTISASRRTRSTVLKRPRSEFPEVTDALLAAVRERFPDRLPDGAVTLETIHLAIGAQHVVRYLEDINRRQQKALPKSSARGAKGSHLILCSRCPNGRIATGCFRARRPPSRGAGVPAARLT